MFSDFTFSTATHVQSLTPMEQQAAACNVMVLQLAIHADITAAPTDAGPSAGQKVNALLFAAEISEMAEA